MPDEYVTKKGNIEWRWKGFKIETPTSKIARGKGWAKTQGRKTGKVQYVKDSKGEYVIDEETGKRKTIGTKKQAIKGRIQEGARPGRKKPKVGFSSKRTAQGRRLMTWGETPGYAGQPFTEWAKEVERKPKKWTWF